MEIIILAETQPKESWQTGIKAFYKQYAIGHNLTNAERDAFHKSHRFENIYGFQNPSLIMRRRIDVLDDKGSLSCREWEYVDCYDGITQAALKFGESDYFRADSKHPLHVQALNTQKRYDELYAEHTELLRVGNGLHEV